MIYAEERAGCQVRSLCQPPRILVSITYHVDFGPDFRAFLPFAMCERPFAAAERCAVATASPVPESCASVLVGNSLPDAPPQRCHPAVCIGQGPRKGAIWCGGVVAGDDYGFETAAAQTEGGGDFADVGGEIGFRDGEHSRQAGWFNPGKVSEIETSSHSSGSTVEWEVREL